jgi:hypothetical protein
MNRNVKSIKVDRLMDSDTRQHHKNAMNRNAKSIKLVQLMKFDTIRNVQNAMNSNVKLTKVGRLTESDNRQHHKKATNRIDGFLIKTIGNEVLEGRGIWCRGSGNLVSRVGELTVSL